MSTKQAKHNIKFKRSNQVHLPTIQITGSRPNNHQELNVNNQTSASNQSNLTNRHKPNSKRIHPKTKSVNIANNSTYTQIKQNNKKQSKQ